MCNEDALVKPGKGNRGRELALGASHVHCFNGILEALKREMTTAIASEESKQEDPQLEQDVIHKIKEWMKHIARDSMDFHTTPSKELTYFRFLQWYQQRMARWEINISPTATKTKAIWTDVVRVGLL